MRSLQTVGQVASIVAALIVLAPSLESPRAETVSPGIVTSDPMPNDVVEGSMVDIILGFEVPVDHERSTLTLRNGNGYRQLRPRLESAPNYLFGIAGRLAPGAYELEWTAWLSGGQIRTGTIPFTVGGVVNLSSMDCRARTGCGAGRREAQSSRRCHAAGLDPGGACLVASGK
jgi:methionine-rich copper-binding protein CopC